MIGKAGSYPWHMSGTRKGSTDISKCRCRVYFSALTVHFNLRADRGGQLHWGRLKQFLEGITEILRHGLRELRILRCATSLASEAPNAFDPAPITLRKGLLRGF